MMKRSSPSAFSPFFWLLCMHCQALLSSAELQGQEQPLPAASGPQQGALSEQGQATVLPFGVALHLLNGSSIILFK